MILSDYSDLGVSYDTSYIDCNMLNIDQYGPVYILTANNNPRDVVEMIHNAFDRSTDNIAYHSTQELVDDIKMWFSHPEQEGSLLDNSFWEQVESLLDSDKARAERDALEWEKELNIMRKNPF
jgi:hypothetical protein